MKKTLSISLANTVFNIEEDAYERLRSYLDSVQQHFSSYSDVDEIVADIESRIAEHLIERKGERHIVTISDIRDLIAVLGEVKDIDNETPEDAKKDSSSESNTSAPFGKRLYRNPDDVVVAGVASGIAAYLGIDPVVVRIAFIVATILWGSSIVIYILLWLIVPKAETMTQKMEMRGEPITLEAVQQTVKEKIEEVQSHKGSIRRVVALPFEILGKILAFIFTRVIPVFLKIFGGVISAAAFIAAILLTILAVTLIVNSGSSYIDIPIAETMSSVLYYGVIAAVYLSIAIPLLLVITFGLALIRKRFMLKGYTSMSLLGVWCLALIAAGSMSISIAARYESYMDRNPEFERMTQSVEVDGFSAIRVVNGHEVRFIQSATTSVSMTGARRNLESMLVSVENGVLTIDQEPERTVCIFCFQNPVTIEIAAPDVDSVEAFNASSIILEGLDAKELIVKASNGSSVTAENVQLALFTAEVSNSSRLRIGGTVETANVQLENSSRLLGEDLRTAAAVVRAENASRAELHVSQTFDARARNSSRIDWDGDAVLIESRDFNSRINHVASEMEEEF